MLAVAVFIFGACSEEAAHLDRSDLHGTSLVLDEVGAWPAPDAPAYVGGAILHDSSVVVWTGTGRMNRYRLGNATGGSGFSYRTRHLNPEAHDTETEAA